MKKLLLSLTVIIGVIFGGLTVAHAENLNYTVSADLPQNQLNSKVSYFDLKVTPGQKQDLTIRIKNSDSQAHKYVITPNRATTNDNGVIDYSQSKAKADASLKFDLKSALSKSQTVSVPAKSTKAVTFKLTVPKKGFEGIALGGINVVQETTASKKKSSGMTIENQYAYVIGLQLQEQAKVTAKPKMKLLGVKAKQVNYRNYVTANLQNNQPVIMHGLKIKSYVTNAGGTKKVVTADKENLAMAPNSNFNFAIGDGTKALKAGNYTLHLTATAEKGNYKWAFTRNFTISEQKAKELNKTAVGQEKQTNYFWWFVGFGVVIVALLGLVIWLLLKNRRHDEKQ
ncbi:DUF916 and DUF3324 domain-containing protein [Lactiplantibacillus sp. WILCCON 0030]|uniref:DUF916 and DUF3324 domain-containing protein n=1 Tax=Lactiplantibacillus brownii TaxID=3069269 RepID=A0ABU1AEJ1_9LACO|nr:DUF916 and DUF3324 domain-containing protein [Lactiplantibacillus brownii]MDQ7938615.1 DUF916 and DUF3324 domain-containing protein [Lactiplantibacillus brownii]